MINEIIVLGNGYCYMVIKEKPKLGDTVVIYNGDPSQYLVAVLTPERGNTSLENRYSKVLWGFDQGWVYKVLASDDPELTHLPNF